MGKMCLVKHIRHRSRNSSGTKILVENRGLGSRQNRVKKMVSQFSMAVKVHEVLSLVNAIDVEGSTMSVRVQPESGNVFHVN